MPNDYGPRHRALRLQWQPVVDEGHAVCHAVVCLHPSRVIPARSAWHLGHTPDGSEWTGPEHPKCNTSDGATRGNRRRRRTSPIASRDW